MPNAARASSANFATLVRVLVVGLLGYAKGAVRFLATLGMTWAGGGMAWAGRNGMGEGWNGVVGGGMAGVGAEWHELGAKGRWLCAGCFYAITFLCRLALALGNLWRSGGGLMSSA